MAEPLQSAWVEKELKRRPSSIRLNAKGVLIGTTKNLQTFILSSNLHLDAFGTGIVYRKDRPLGIGITGLTSKAHRTYEYWRKVRSISSNELNLSKESKPAEVERAFATAVKAIRDLPTLGVDLDAVESADAVATSMTLTVAVYRRNNKSDRLTESFVRGLLGDPFGVAEEMAQDVNAVQSQVEATKVRCRKARLALTDRYEMEFPKLSED